jgi:hypothetical protein
MCPTVGLLGWKRDIKDDECERSGYDGENVDQEDGIFRFEGEYKGERVWMILVSAGSTNCLVLGPL